MYGPMGRPDMVYFKFAEMLRTGGTIKIYNMGDCQRDFTYIDDSVEGICRAMRKPLEDCGIGACYKVYNIGDSHPARLLDFVATLQKLLVEEWVLPEGHDFEAHHELVLMQPGDVVVTHADTTEFKQDFGHRSSTELEAGLGEFARWYARYRGIWD